VTLIQIQNDDGLRTDGKTLLIWGARVQSIGLWIMQFQITQFLLCTYLSGHWFKDWCNFISCDFFT